MCALRVGMSTFSHCGDKILSFKEKGFVPLTVQGYRPAWRQKQRTRAGSSGPWSGSVVISRSSLTHAGQAPTQGVVLPTVGRA